MDKIIILLLSKKEMRQSNHLKSNLWFKEAQRGHLRRVDVIYEESS